MYDELIQRLRDDEAWKNCDFDFIYDWMHQAADAIEQLQKDLERSKEYEAFWEKEANEALRKFQVAIASKPRWIPVTERLPKEEETVLAFGTLGMAWLDWRHDNKWCCYGGVTHWMPLPQLPKEGP